MLEVKVTIKLKEGVSDPDGANKAFQIQMVQILSKHYIYLVLIMLKMLKTLELLIF
jgi:hypothetical protein